MAPKKKQAQAKTTKAASPQRPTKRTGAPSLRQHFEQAGILFGLPEHEIIGRLKKLLGPTRHRRWREAALARHDGWGNPESEYGILKSAEEINTLFSLQSDISLRMCEWLAAQVTGAGLEAGKIGDLGCGAGVFAGWLASQHPHCNVIGCDAMANLLKAAEVSQEYENLSFVNWNYAEDDYPLAHSCDILVTCFGIDFPILPQSYSLTAEDKRYRQSEYYRKMFGVIRPYFRGWRTAVKEQGLLYAVLRISSELLFLALVDAAYAEGWLLDPEPYEYLHSVGENFPALTFRAVDGPAHAEEFILSLWCRPSFRKSFSTEVFDFAATCGFLSLREKTILKTDYRHYDDGHSMEALVGSAGYLGFQYTHATTGFARLRLMSIDDATRAEPWFPDPKPFGYMDFSE